MVELQDKIFNFEDNRYPEYLTITCNTCSDKEQHRKLSI